MLFVDQDLSCQLVLPPQKRSLDRALDTIGPDRARDVATFLCSGNAADWKTHTHPDNHRISATSCPVVVVSN